MGKIQYYYGGIHLPLEKHFKTTEKLVYFQVGTDVYDSSKTIEVAIPRSQIITTQPDRTGFGEIFIPIWLIEKLGIYKNLIHGITNFPGEPDVVWRENVGLKFGGDKEAKEYGYGC